jgi:hypothetical protein
MMRVNQPEKELRTVSKVSLEIYVEDGCMVCRRSLELAQHVERVFPEVSLAVIDLSEDGGRHRDLAVAVPTFVLNGRRISLGNPSLQELQEAISNLLKRESA